MNAKRPARLYHYQRFAEEHVATLLSARKVKLARADSFNDPWDCRLRYMDPEDAAATERILLWFTTMHRKHYSSISEDKRMWLVHSFRSDTGKLRAALREMEQQMYAEICRMYRIYCLTEKPASALMWSHYAEAHAGVCLEFDAGSPPFGDTTKVEYQRIYPIFDLVNVGYEPLVTKSDDWSYEAEWRLIAEERAAARSPDTIKTDSDFLTLPVGALKSITIGCLADTKRRDLVGSLVSALDPSILIRQAEMAPDTYDLRITPPIE